MTETATRPTALKAAPDKTGQAETDGKDGSVIVFDLKTFEKTGEPSVGKNPANVLPAPVGAISRAERPARALSRRAS